MVKVLGGKIEKGGKWATVYYRGMIGNGDSTGG